jgi:hypothetical protein
MPSNICLSRNFKQKLFTRAVHDGSDKTQLKKIFEEGCRNCPQAEWNPDS